MSYYRFESDGIATYQVYAAKGDCCCSCVYNAFVLLRANLYPGMYRVVVLQTTVNTCAIDTTARVSSRTSGWLKVMMPTLPLCSTRTFLNSVQDYANLKPFFVYPLDRATRGCLARSIIVVAILLCSLLPLSLVVRVLAGVVAYDVCSMWAWREKGSLCEGSN